MNVTGRYDRLVETLTEFDYPLVYLHDVFHGIDILYPVGIDHVHIVAQRLYLKIVVVIHDGGYLRFRSVFEYCFKQFTRFTGCSEDESLPVSVEQALGYAGLSSVKIL